MCVTENYFSYISAKTDVVGTQKNRLIESVLLSTQNMFRLLGKKIIAFLGSKTLLNWTYVVWVQTVCKDYQQTTKFTTSRQRVYVNIQQIIMESYNFCVKKMEIHKILCILRDETKPYKIVANPSC